MTDHVDTEALWRAARCASDAADRMHSATANADEVANRLARLFDPGYGGDAALLIELLQQAAERDTRAIELQERNAELEISNAEMSKQLLLLSDPQRRIAELEKQLDAARTTLNNKRVLYHRASEELQSLRELHAAMISLVNESTGVAGWHKNGDIATWEELGVTQYV